MIISKTPLRVSFFGGGTDIPSYYKNNQYGSVVSTSINKYIYVSVKKHSDLFKEKYRLNYSETEITNTKNQIKNNIIKETLNYMNIEDSLYISTIADIPGSSGLGSSSSFCVGLVNCLYKYKGINASNRIIANTAANIEMNILNKPIGKQDHYAAAIGGFNYFKFMKDESVLIKKINSIFLKKIFDNSLFFWTGDSRNAEDVLSDQLKNKHKNSENLSKIKDLSDKYKKIYKLKLFSIKQFATDLNFSWNLKKKLSGKISNDKIDKAYETALINGASGGKILGAGNGGFLLIIANKKYHQGIIQSLKKINFKLVDFSYSNYGTKLISGGK